MEALIFSVFIEIASIFISIEIYPELSHFMSMTNNLKDKN